MEKDIKSIEIPLDKEKSKKINSKALSFIENFLYKKFTVELSNSLDDELPILRITKK